MIRRCRWQGKHRLCVSGKSEQNEREERKHETTLLGGTAVFCDAVIPAARQRTGDRGGHAGAGNVRDGGKRPRVYP